MRVWQLNSLKKCAGNIHADQRNTISIQFLQGFNSSSTAALSLGRVDHLPRLVVFLLHPVARVMEIENHSNQDRKAAQIFQDLQKSPIAEQESDPLEGPFNDEEKHHPRMPQAALLFAPRPRALPSLTCDHDLEILRQDGISGCYSANPVTI